MSEYEFFRIYGFRTVYPVDWKVELDPKSERSEGNVTFKSPEKIHIVVSWGSLEKTKKKYSSLEEHARDSVNRIKKDRKIEKVELIQTKSVKVNSHKAIFSHIRIAFSVRKLLPFGKGKTHEREVRSLHLYCRPSGRYFVVYGVTTTDKSLQQCRIFEKIIKSFVCHKTKANPTDQ
jgi:predicted DNA-binding transcriptional regulator YafY